MKIKSIFLRISEKITKLFASGLILLLPVTLTSAVLLFSLRIIIKWLTPLRALILSTPLIDLIPHIEILLAFLIIIGAGIIYNFFIIRTIIHALESLVVKIPVIRPVYSSFKQLAKSFNLQDKMMFKSVVIVEFPRQGIYSIGFLTNEVDKTLLSQLKSKSMTSPEPHRIFTVYMAATPNPTHGYLIAVPDHQITIANLSTQEAMTMIISGGIIRPDSDHSKIE